MQHDQGKHVVKCFLTWAGYLILVHCGDRDKHRFQGLNLAKNLDYDLDLMERLMPYQLTHHRPLKIWDLQRFSLYQSHHL